jgi:hypothetical protein
LSQQVDDLKKQLEQFQAMFETQNKIISSLQAGNVPPQSGNVPPQSGNVPPQSGNVPPQSGNIQAKPNIPYKPKPSTKKPIDRELPHNPDNPDDPEEIREDRGDYINNYIKIDKEGIWKKITKEYLADYSNDFLDAPISTNFINNRTERQILDLILSIDPLPTELDKKGKVYNEYSTGLYRKRIDELENFVKSRLAPKISAGRARLSKKEVLKILKSKTTKSSSAIKNIEKEILNILNS